MNVIDLAYKRIQNMIIEAKEIEETVKNFDTYNYLDYLNNVIQRFLQDARPKLIEQHVAKYIREYTPNYTPTIKFEKVMDSKVGRTEFNSEIIENHFKQLANNKQELTRLSLQQILDRACSFRSGSYYNKPKPEDMTSGKQIILSVHSWNQSYGGKGYVSIHSPENFEALQSLIDHMFLGHDPTVKPKTMFLSEHIKNNDPNSFYGKKTVKHPIIEAFQFYKNGKLKIWFKRNIYSKQLATKLINHERS